MPKISLRLHSITSFTSRLLLYTFSFGLTIFILANGYETASGQNIPLFRAVQSVSLDFISTSDTMTLAQKDNTDQYEGNYGQPDKMKIPMGGAPIPLANAYQNKSEWLARSSTAYYRILTTTKNGYIGDVLVYTIASPTTVQEDKKLENGSNIFIETKRGWRYYFKVNETIYINGSDAKITLPQSEKNNRLFFVIKGSANYQIIYATLMNVQNANQ